MQYAAKLDQIGFTDPRIRAAADAALVNFSTNVGEDQTAAAWLMENIAGRPDLHDKHPEVEIKIHMWELDYTFGRSVYSATPRLLLKVPSTYRDGQGPRPAIEHDEVGPKQNVPKLGYNAAPLPKGSVIIFPNQEGQQANVADRPVVQWSGICPGEYFIMGKFLAADEVKIKDIIQSIIGAPPPGQSLWQHYASKATIDDLSDIMIKLRVAGFSNQYNTDEKYLDLTKPHDGKPEYTRAAGLHCRDRDKELCSAIYFPGEVELGFYPREIIAGGGFAVAIKQREGGSLVYRPVSSQFMQDNYRDFFSGEPVKPMEGVVNIWFRADHPMRTHSNALGTLLKDLHAINTNIGALNAGGELTVGSRNGRSNEPRHRHNLPILPIYDGGLGISPHRRHPAARPGTVARPVLDEFVM